MNDEMVVDELAYMLILQFNGFHFYWSWMKPLVRNFESCDLNLNTGNVIFQFKM
jgi:hypothetical protein